jgi:hypothetical protein
VTAWLITTPFEAEGSFVTDDEGVLELAKRIIREAPVIDNGDEYIIRKANYMRTKPVANPNRVRHLTVVR